MGPKLRVKRSCATSDGTIAVSGLTHIRILLQFNVIHSCNGSLHWVGPPWRIFPADIDDTSQTWTHLKRDLVGPYLRPFRCGTYFQNRDVVASNNNVA